MKKFYLFPVAFLLFLASCQRESNMPLSQNCHINKIYNYGELEAELNYDDQGRLIKVVYPQGPTGSFHITYSAGQKITETDSISGDYEKRIFTYDANNKLVNIKSYFEYNSSVVDEEYIVTWNGNEAVADTMRTSGSEQITQYVWQNGNIVKLIRDGQIIHRGYDNTKLSMEGDASWRMSVLENTGLFLISRNLVVYEYEEGIGTQAGGTINYTFDGSGKITRYTWATPGLEDLTYTYQCN